MVTCREVREQLYFFLDDRLEKKEASFIQEHLDACPGCRREHQLESNLNLKLKDQALWEEVPSALGLRVRIALREQKRDRTALSALWAFFYQQRAFVAVAGLVLIALGVTINLREGTQATKLVAHMVRDHHVLHLGRGSQDLAVPVPEVAVAMHQMTRGEVHLPTASQPGLEVLGARFCKFEGQKTPMIVYLVAGKEVSLHALARPVKGFKGFEKVSLKGETMYVGSANGFQTVLYKAGDAFCLLAGDLPRQKLLELASSIL